jgi:hypothetical protein
LWPVAVQEETERKKERKKGEKKERKDKPVSHNTERKRTHLSTGSLCMSRFGMHGTDETNERREERKEKLKTAKIRKQKSVT